MFHAYYHSLILAQIFGLYMIIIAVIMLSRATLYRSIVQGINPHGIEIIMGASFGLMLGLFLVVIHNTWIWNPEVVVTVVCWWILIKSILWLSFPERMLAITKTMAAGNAYYVVLVIMFLVGLFLLTKGFYFAIHHPQIAVV